MDFPSKYLEDAVLEIAKLPGIGKKTALRLALHLLKGEEEVTSGLTESLNTMRLNIKKCTTCQNISDHGQCKICLSRNRDRSVICVVEGVTDLMALENTSQYQGMYHVLGGVISPMDGVGPDDLTISELIERSREEGVCELIFALNSTLESETTTFYISKKVQREGLKVTSIARGVPVGGELEYIDEVTLARSMASRISYK